MKAMNLKYEHCVGSSKNCCSLCGFLGKLSQSHIIPRFVFVWFKDTSPTGYLRQGENVNIRQRDGKKLKLLCSQCENKFSRVEKAFSEKIFLPFHNNKLEQIEYDEWLYKFIVSISWRVLKVYEDEATNESQFAMKIWSDYLLRNIMNADLDSFERRRL